MNLKKRIQAFINIGEYIKKDIYEDAKEDLINAEIINPWFTQENIKNSLSAWQEQLQYDILKSWIEPYKLNEIEKQKKVLVIMAGNIPLVGFHDFISVLISGHKLVVKMSSTDNVLLKIIIKKLNKIDPYFKDSISLISDLKVRDFDAVIATGSNNSAQYFEYYFKKAKKIIRKNRRSIAVLDGTESIIELEGLSNDIFTYFGLGCRNVSKLFLPKDYDLDKLFEVFYPFNKIIKHKKYANNYDYNKSIFLMGSNKLVENGFLLMKEEKSLLSPVAMLYYEYYEDIETVKQFVNENSDQLQCIVSKKEIPFGKTQKPNLWNYADSVDTVEFLRKL
jgi:hypothetical protein